MRLFEPNRLGMYPADRKMGLANLKNFIARAKDGRHWIAGRDSGFPPCCNAYFHVRGAVMDLWIMAFGNYGYFHDPNPRDPDANRLQHVCCPLHKFLYRNGRGFVYLHCVECNWMQLNSRRCNKCGGCMVRGSSKVLARAGFMR